MLAWEGNRNEQTALKGRAAPRMGSIMEKLLVGSAQESLLSLGCSLYWSESVIRNRMGLYEIPHETKGGSSTRFHPRISSLKG